MCGGGGGSRQDQLLLIEYLWCGSQVEDKINDIIFCRFSLSPFDHEVVALVDQFFLSLLVDRIGH